MKKLPLVLLSIALILFAFSSCSNSTGTPEPSQEDIDAVKNGINAEAIIKDAFSGKDGIEVEYEYAPAKSMEASLKAIVSFHGYASGSLKITAGSLEFVFSGTLDGTSFSATTYSAKTTARLEVSSGNGNPVPVSIDIPESANATAEVKATITDGVLSATSIQVTINNLPESSTATITIADEEAATVAGSGNEAGGATGGGGGGTVTPPGGEENPGTGEGGDDPVTPPAGETKEYPIPVFLSSDDMTSTVSMMLYSSKNQISDEAMPTAEDKYFLYRISCPALIGFENKEKESSYEDSLFGHSLTINIEEENGVYTYTGNSDTAAIELVFDSKAQKYNYLQVTKESYNMPDTGMIDFYIIAESSDISKPANGDTWSGDLSVYVWMKQENSTYVFYNTLSAIFNSNKNATGLASYKGLQNPNIENVPNDIEVDINKAKALINAITELPGMDELGPYYELVYYDANKGEFEVYYNTEHNGNPTAQRDDCISHATNAELGWNLNDLPMPDTSIPETSEQA